MKKFADTEKREWVVTIHVDAIKRIRAELGLDLNKALEENFKLLTEVMADPVTLVEVLFVLCREQAQAAAVNDEDFGRAMGGDCLLAAGEAFVEALIDFFPHARARASLTAILAKGKTVRNLLLERAAAQIEAMDPAGIATAMEARATAEAQGRAAEKAESILTGSSGNSPGSAASTPAP